MVCSLFGTFAILAFGQGDQPTVEEAFVNYKQEFQRKYADSSDEHKVRFQRFKIAYSDVYKTNDALVVGGEFQFNEYSDSTADEFYQHRLGFVFKNDTKPTFLGQSLASSVGSEVVADSMDWISQGAVTPVKNQQTCGSCWAFTVTGALEGAVKVRTGTLIDLSEEQFLDCDTVDDGCQGGALPRAFQWATSAGLCSEQQYPYNNGQDSTCETECNTIPGGCVMGYRIIPVGEQNLLAVVSAQPASVAIAGGALAGYSSGSVGLRSPCSMNMIDHGVVVVGFTPDYWTIKNSWGTGWGEGGYARLTRDASQGPLGPFCIYAQPVVPTISPFCSVNPAGVSDKDNLWKRVFGSAFFWPVVIAILCSSCLIVIATVSHLRSRGRKAKQLSNTEQGSGVSMLGF